MEALRYFLLVFLLPLLLILHKKITCKAQRSLELPPSPLALPLPGHVHIFRKTPLHEALRSLSYKYGQIILLQLVSKPVLVVSDPQLVEECFTKNDIVFSNRPQFPSRKPLEYGFTGMGSVPYGHRWRNLRRFSAIEIFSATRLAASAGIRTEEIRLIAKELSKGGSKKVEVNSLFFVLTFNIMMKMVDGRRHFLVGEQGLEAIKGELERIRGIFNPMLQATVGDYFPWLRWLSFYGLEKRLLRVHKGRDEFMQRMIDNHRNNGPFSPSSHDEDEHKRRTIINVMLKLQGSEPEFYTDDTIKGIILVMLIAGTHTSAMAMEFAVSQLISHPEILAKAQKEIDERVGSSQLVDDSNIPGLPYLNCIIKESLRLGPAAPLIPPREPSEECMVGGYRVPRGTMLLVNAWQLHRDPGIWEDPSEFKPERFLDCTDRGSERLKFGFIPFGCGRRQCPGSGLALRLVALTIATLVQCFDWEAANGGCDRQDKPVEVVFRSRGIVSEVLSLL